MTSVLLRLPCSRALHHLALQRHLHPLHSAPRGLSGPGKRSSVAITAAQNSEDKGRMGKGAIEAVKPKGYQPPGPPAADRSNIAQVKRGPQV